MKYLYILMTLALLLCSGHFLILDARADEIKEVQFEAHILIEKNPMKDDSATDTEEVRRSLIMLVCSIICAAISFLKIKNIIKINKDISDEYAALLVAFLCMGAIVAFVSIISLSCFQYAFVIKVFNEMVG